MVLDVIRRHVYSGGVLSIMAGYDDCFLFEMIDNPVDGRTLPEMVKVEIHGKTYVLPVVVGNCHYDNCPVPRLAWNRENMLYVSVGDVMKGAVACKPRHLNFLKEVKTPVFQSF